jgi:hypothetical protein
LSSQSPVAAARIHTDPTDTAQDRTTDIYTHSASHLKHTLWRRNFWNVIQQDYNLLKAYGKNISALQDYKENFT